MNKNTIKDMSIYKKVLVCFGLVLCVSGAALPLVSHAEEIIVEETAVTVTIEDYYEFSVVSTVAGDADVSVTDGTYSSTMTNGSRKETFGTTTFLAATNDTRGWKVTAKGTTNDGNGHSTMVGAATGLTIPSISTNLASGASTWTMKIAAGEGAPTITSGYTANSLIPASATTVVTGAYGEGREFSVTYGVAVSSFQAADTYTGSVEYILTPNSGS